MSFRDNLITEPLASINEALDGVEFRFYRYEDSSAAARVEKWDAHGPVEIVAAGSPHECWQFVRGLETALEVVNRLPVG